MANYDLASIIIVNAIGMIITLIILFSVKKNVRRNSYDTKLFYILCISVLVMNILEPLVFCFDRANFQGGEFLNRLGNVILFIGNPITPLIWVLYVDYNIYKDEERLKKFSIILLLIISFTVIISMVNLFTDFLFTIKPGNIYERTPFFSLLYIPIVILVIIPIVELYINRKMIRKRVYAPLISFMFIPVCGAILQLFFYGISVIWVCISISLINVYINVQSDMSITDYLTGLFNRRELENYMNVETRKFNNNCYLAGIMIDVDDFKQINDRFGHDVGDDALENLADILRKSINKEDFVSRYAGDEFVIVIKTININDVEILINKIKMNTNLFNNTKGKEYKLSLSMGYTFYDGKSINNVDSFFKKMDDNMYKVKVMRKANKKLSSSSIDN